MASESSSQERIELVIPADDLILPFQADQADVVGRLVKLGPLLGAALKFEGKFILQASTDGPVDLLVADYQVPGGLRGYARFSPQRVEALESALGPPRPIAATL